MNKIILLRGLAREHLHWDPEFLNALGRRKIEPVMLDLPGAGDYRDIVSPLHIADYSAFLQTQWQLLREGDEKVYLAGHSFGAMIALRWAFERPEQFHGVFLINTSDRKSPAIPRRSSIYMIKQMLKALAYSDIQKKEQSILEMVSNLETARAKNLPRWVQLAAERPMKTLSQINQVIAAMRFRAPEKLALSSVYIASRADRMVSYQCSEKMAAEHKAPLLLHDKAGHDIAMDAPEWLAEQIQSHIRTR